MKPDRTFYSAAAAFNLAIMFVGFMPFYLSGRGQHDRVIAPAIFTLVAVHGFAITGWYLLSFVQSLLVTTRKHRLHMKLGWSAVGFGVVIAVTGVMVAFRSVQGDPDFVFFGMAYPDFLLVMITEIVAFTGLLLVGLSMRKRPEIHRAMMLLASLSLLLGATARMPVLEAVFPGHGLVSFFGPVFALGALLLLLHFVLTRRFDRAFAAGYGVLVVAYAGAEHLSRTDAWRRLAGAWLEA